MIAKCFNAFVLAGRKPVEAGEPIKSPLRQSEQLDIRRLKRHRGGNPAQIVKLSRVLVSQIHPMQRHHRGKTVLRFRQFTAERARLRCSRWWTRSAVKI